MRRNSALLVLSVCLAFPMGIGFSQDRRGSIPHDHARRNGLKSAWTTQLDLNPNRGRVVHIQPHVSSSRAITAYEVFHGTGKEVIRTSDLDRTGQPLGKNGAAVAAAKRMRAILRADPDSLADPEVAQTAELVEKLIRDGDQLPKPRPATTDDDDENADETAPDLATSLLQRAQAKPEVFPQLRRRVIPEVRLYAASATGIVHAIDGETGATLWSNKIGRSTLVTQGPAANDTVVAVFNGGTLFVLDAADGQLLWKKQVSSFASGRRISEVPSAAPAISDTQILVPTVRGDLLGYDLREPKLFPTRYGALGRALIQPIVATQSVAWPTTARARRRGSAVKSYLYVANANEAGTRYRLESTELIMGAPAFQTFGGQTRFFVAARDGFLTCISERSGRLIWRFSTGEPLAHQPVVFGNGVYTMSEHGGIFRVDATSGKEVWRSSGIYGFVAASRDRLYCTDAVGRVIVLDAVTGSHRAVISANQLNVKLVNTLTDRLYMGTRTGLLQCLHEPEHDWPLIHEGTEEETKDAAGAGKAPKDSSPSDREPAPKPVDPNPFGGGEEKPAAGDDPFADSDKPAAKKPPADDDPFK